MCEREGVDPVTANRAHVAVFVRELTSRAHHRGANVVAIDSGAGLANATIQQRLVPVRLFYDFLMEEGLRESNRWVGAVTPLAAALAELSAAWCRGCPGCRGSPASSSGRGFWRRPAASRRVTG